MKTLLDIPYAHETLQVFENKPFFVENRLTIQSDFEMCYREFMASPITPEQAENKEYIKSCQELKTNYFSIYISAVLYSLEPSSGIFRKMADKAAPKLIL